MNIKTVALVLISILSVIVVLTVVSFPSEMDPVTTNQCCNWTDYGVYAPSDYKWRVDVHDDMYLCPEIYLDDCQRSVTDTVCVPIDGKSWNESKSGECNPTLMSVMDAFEHIPSLSSVLIIVILLFVILAAVMKHPEWFNGEGKQSV